MGVKGRDKDFRTPKVTHFEFKYTEMDRVLTMLFPRLKFDGSNSRISRKKLLEIEDFVNEFNEREEWFKGFSEHENIVYKWVETDLMDVVNRGRASQAIAAPRPLHGNTYKFRNTKHARDFGASEQVYWMLYYARKGRGQTVRDALKSFFFKGYDFITDKYDQNAVLDVETQALLRLDHQVTQDTKDSKETGKTQPLCIGNSDIFADDILRLLAYEKYIPRSVLVDYLKTLIAFHLSLYHLKLIQILPKIIKQKCGNHLCSLKECPAEPGQLHAMDGCPFKIALIVDMGDINNAHMSELAKRSADRFYRQIPLFVQSTFIVKKLDEMAEYLNRTGKFDIPPDGITVPKIIELLSAEYDSERIPYFKSRLARLIEESSSGSGDVEPEIKEVTSMGLDDFDTFIEVLMSYRGKYHQKYITQSMDSLLLKNKESGLLVQSRSKGSPRKFMLGSKLLEVLLQLAVLRQEGGNFITCEIRVEELLDFLRERYGIYIDRLSDELNEHESILDRRALRLNHDAFKRRLREIGFYEDLSDAYITQKVCPRYTIEKSDS